MATELSEVGGMAFIGATPWHKLGTRLDETATMDDWYIKAGLDFQVEKVQLHTYENEQAKPVNFFATVRSDTRKVLGYVGDSWRPLQNKDAFGWFKPYIESGLCKLHTAGVLREGGRVWVLANIVDDKPLEVVKGDEIAQFLMLSNGHDGKLSVRVGFTPIRIVCANTLRMAHNDKASKLIRVRHSGKVKQNVDSLRDVIDLAKREFAGTVEQYQALARRNIVKSDLEKYFRTVLKVEQDKERKDLPTRTQNRLDDMFKLFETGKGSELQGVKGTAWGAYNAVTEFLTWEAGRNVDNRFDSLWFGQNANVNQLAFETALTLAA